MTQFPVSLQLFTVRDDLARDIHGTFKTIAGIGYKNVEGAGFAGLTAQEYGKVLHDNGLSIPGAHISLDALLNDFEQTIADYKGLGVKTFIVPHISPEKRNGGAGYGNVAEELNTVGSKLKAAGVKLAYHNHAFEFEDTDGGKTGYEILLANTDPALVSFELDTFWALAADVDPVAFIKEHSDRILLLHIKDMDPDDRTFAPVGTGILPLDGILAAAPSNVEYLVVEQDRCTKQTALESIKISYDTLKGKGYS